MSDTDQLQELVDGLAARVARPVLLEDPWLRLVAYSQTGEDSDPVRLRSILRRESPDDVRAWLFAHGLHELREPAVLPPVDDLGMRERVCCPVRHAGALLGYLWILGAGDGVLAAAGPAAVAAGPLLHHRRLEEGRERAVQVAGLEARVFGAGAGPVAVIGAREGEPGVLQAALEQALRRVTGGAGGRCLLRGGELVLAGAALPDLVTALAGVPGPCGVGGTLATARRAALLARLLEAGGVLAVDDVPLEAHVLAAAGDDPGRIVVPPVVRALLAPGLGDLAATVETYLDLGGDIGAATGALAVSRAGLYRRLHRAQELAGFDLRDGAQRTLVHLGLKAARLTRERA